MRNINLGFCYWGFCEEYEDSIVVDTPDGGRYTRPLFVKELSQNGFNVIALQQQRESKPIKELSFSNDYPNIDALFIEWRWSTWKNDPSNSNWTEETHETDLERQTRLMDYYHGRIPIIVWDTDLKVTHNDIKTWPKTKWFEPTILHDRPNFGTLLYFSDFVVRHPFQTVKPRYIYVGSNYERYWGVDKYYFGPGKKLKDAGISIEFYGNWLNKSPERPEQEERVKYYSEYIKFNKRNKYLEGMELINNSICTTHIVKDEYCRKGLITPRFFESIMCGTPALIPEEFLIPVYGLDWVVTKENIVDKILKIKNYEVLDRFDIVAEQAQNVRKKLPECYVKNIPAKIKKILEV